MQIQFTNEDILTLIRMAKQYFAEAEATLKTGPNEAATALRLANDLTEQASILLTVANQK